MHSDAARGRGVLIAGLLCALGGDAPAVENRVNLNVELGPLLNLGQPVVSPLLQVAVTGVHVRAAVEYVFHERLALEVAYDPNFLFAGADNRVTAQQNILVGGRSRLWYRESREYLLPRRDGVKLAKADYFSDVWLDFHIGPSLAERTRLYYDVGIGTRLPIYKPIQIGFFVRFAQLLVQSGDENTFKQLMFGLTFSAGLAPLHGEPDTDKDGVVDASDRCPDTRPGAHVNSVGCEVPAEGSPPPLCADTDLDGVCDGVDACPDTPLGVPVDARGCPAVAPAKPASSSPASPPYMPEPAPQPR